MVEKSKIMVEKIFPAKKAVVKYINFGEKKMWCKKINFFLQKLCTHFLKKMV